MIVSTDELLQDAKIKLETEIKRKRNEEVAMMITIAGVDAEMRGYKENRRGRSSDVKI
jgi:hypothetical protein